MGEFWDYDPDEEDIWGYILDKEDWLIEDEHDDYWDADDYDQPFLFDGSQADT